MKELTIRLVQKCLCSVVTRYRLGVVAAERGSYGRRIDLRHLQQRAVKLAPRLHEICAAELAWLGVVALAWEARVVGSGENNGAAEAVRNDSR